jgi:hypothetical protein
MFSKSGEYSGKLFKLLIDFFGVSDEYLTAETGLNAEALRNMLTLPTLEKPFGARLLTALRLTHEDYCWFQMIMGEINESRETRIQKIEAIRQKQLMDERRKKYENQEIAERQRKEYEERRAKEEQSRKEWEERCRQSRENAERKQGKLKIKRKEREKGDKNGQKDVRKAESTGKSAREQGNKGPKKRKIIPKGKKSAS